MYLKSAVFENFRNIKGFSFDFDKEMNILFGGNAQGKTAVIEGIYLFAGGHGENLSRLSQRMAVTVKGKRMTETVLCRASTT